MRATGAPRPSKPRLRAKVSGHFEEGSKRGCLWTSDGGATVRVRVGAQRATCSIFFFSSFPSPSRNQLAESSRTTHLRLVVGGLHFD